MSVAVISALTAIAEPLSFSVPFVASDEILTDCSVFESLSLNPKSAVVSV